MRSRVGIRTGRRLSLLAPVLSRICYIKVATALRKESHPVFLCVNPECPNSKEREGAQFLVNTAYGAGRYTQDGDYLGRTGNLCPAPGTAQCAECLSPARWEDASKEGAAPAADESAEERYLADAILRLSNLNSRAVAGWQEVGDELLEQFEEDAARLAEAADVPLGTAAAMLYLSLIQRIELGGILEKHEHLIRDPRAAVD